MSKLGNLTSRRGVEPALEYVLLDGRCASNRYYYPKLYKWVSYGLFAHAVAVQSTAGDFRLNGTAGDAAACTRVAFATDAPLAFFGRRLMSLITASLTTHCTAK